MPGSSVTGLPTVCQRYLDNLPTVCQIDVRPLLPGALSPRPGWLISRCGVRSPVASERFWETVGRLGLLSWRLWALRLFPRPHRITIRVSDGADVIAAVQSERLEGPTFAFYTSFDLVLAPEWALIVSQTEFERLFRDAGLVEQHINEWVAGIEQYLPWAPGSVDALAEVASRDSRIWRRLREINRRGHLTNVTIDQVRDYAVQMNLDIDHLIDNDQLIFDPEERFTTLHLLNEDLFRGPLSEERFEAQRKTTA